MGRETSRTCRSSFHGGARASARGRRGSARSTGTSRNHHGAEPFPIALSSVLRHEPGSGGYRDHRSWTRRSTGGFTRPDPMRQSPARRIQTSRAPRRTKFRRAVAVCRYPQHHASNGAQLGLGRCVAWSLRAVPALPRTLLSPSPAVLRGLRCATGTAARSAGRGQLHRSASTFGGGRHGGSAPCPGSRISGPQHAGVPSASWHAAHGHAGARSRASRWGAPRKPSALCLAPHGAMVCAPAPRASSRAMACPGTRTRCATSRGRRPSLTHGAAAGDH